MNIQKFTQKSLEAIQSAQTLAAENQNAQVEQEHLLLALLEQDNSLIKELLKKISTTDGLEDELRNIVNNMPQITKARVFFTNGYVVKPWDKFGYTQYLDKNGNVRYKLLPNCNTPSWWSDYNKMKHQRTSRNSDGEINFVKANLKNMVLSLAALFSLEALYMDIITPEIGPDCNIEENQLFELTCSDSIEFIGDT